MVWAPIRLLDIQQKKVERATGVDLPSYGGVVANSYLPSNWLSALGLYARRGSMNLPITILSLTLRRSLRTSSTKR
ncbi:hypothetical protein DMI62_00655 [Escherichia coli]|nr:hypothetical protein [Escherichia coli]